MQNKKLKLKFLMINLTEACKMNHRSGGTGAGRIWELTSVSWGQAKGGDSDIQWFFFL